MRNRRAGGAESMERALANSVRRRWPSRSQLAYGMSVSVLLAALFVLLVLRDYFQTSEADLTRSDVWRVRVAIALLILVTTLAVGGLVHRGSRLMLASRTGRPASRFHIRLARRFALIGLAPVCLSALLALATVVYGLDRWFDERVQGAVDGAAQLADGVAAHLGSAGRRGAEQALFERRLQRRLRQRPALSSRRLEEELALAGERMSEAGQADAGSRWTALAGRLLRSPVSANRVALFQGLELLDWKTSEEAARAPAVEPGDLSRATEAGAGHPVEARGRSAPETRQDRWRLQTLTLLPGGQGLYLFADSTALAGFLPAAEAVAMRSLEYRQAIDAGLGLAWGFALIYGVGTLIVAVAAILVGFLFADQMVGPVRRLAAAAAKIKGGDLSVRVPEPRPRIDEVGALIQTFNEMTGSLQRQRAQLEASYRADQERRLFLEGLLSSATTGIVGLDAAGRVEMFNHAAIRLLGTKGRLKLGEELAKAVPEAKVLLKEAAARRHRVAETQIDVDSKQAMRHLLVRSSAKSESGEILGFVLTLEDITGRLLAQRMETWQQLAGMLAHEVRNPINRLGQKAQTLAEVLPLQPPERQQQALLENYRLVSRVVGQIRQLVEDFRTFAERAEPHLEWVDLTDLIDYTVDLAGRELEGIEVRTEVEPGLAAACDRNQISRALFNILKNAALATREMADRCQREGTERARQVAVRAASEADRIAIVVEDNGIGLPTADRTRILEPYVTGRKAAGGVGLGLAIVRWLMESHEGEVLLQDRADGSPGARVALRFPAAGPGNRTARA